MVGGWFRDPFVLCFLAHCLDWKDQLSGEFFFFLPFFSRSSPAPFDPFFPNDRTVCDE